LVCISLPRFAIQVPLPLEAEQSPVSTRKAWADGLQMVQLFPKQLLRQLSIPHLISVSQGVWARTDRTSNS
jgi:hypothetical protein